MSGFFEACGSNAMATAFVDYGVKPTVRHVGYVFRFNKIVEDLREKIDQLKVTQASVEARVQDAENQIQTIDVVVEDWREKACTLQEDVEGFLQVKIQENKRCFNWCWRRYQLSKQAAQKSLSISGLLKKETEFKVIGHPADLPGITRLRSKGFMSFKSAHFTERQIMEALKDDGVNIIGVWGMGGVGKTTLVKEVGRKAEELKLFGQVVVVTVSQNPNIEKIQNTIAESLNSRLSNTTENGKAGQLWTRLQNEKSILIILDDLWKKLNLKAVGIPVDEHQHKGCKILLTTRSQQVCSLMGSGKVVQLNVLGKDEACQLFKSCAGLDDGTSPEILEVAAEVVKECKGLPIALSGLGKALKGARLHKWREASQSLKNSTLLDMEGVAEDDKNAYMCLKLSYDFLRLDNTKKCFLLCSLYPEDHSILIEELVRHAWGLEFFKGRNSIQEARNAVRTALDDLKACSLLLDNGEDWVKMHDMVRDVALWIGSPKQNHFVIKSELGAKEWPNNEKSEHCTAISFMDCDIKGTPEGLDYSELGFLSFSDGNLDEEKTMMLFSGASFEGMKSLKVLNLVGIKGSLSQDALKMLTNLRCLYLEYCKLNTYTSFSSLGNLKKLEILSFFGSDIEVLPDGVGELTSLRLLDLSYCRRLKRIPPNVMRRLSQLEELYLRLCGFKFDEWVVEGSTDAEVRNASLLELNELSHLTTLVLGVGDPERVPKDFVFPKLQNFSIGIGDYVHKNYPSRRCLNIHKAASFHAFKNLLGVVDVLELNNIVNCQSLDDARNYQHVPVTLSNLSVLKIQDMNCFRGLCNGQPPDGFLKKLETLEITKCGSLKSVFPASVTKNLKQLKSVKIVDCDMLEQIFEEMEGANDEVLQKLETLEIRGCSNLKSLFPPPVAKNLVQLKSVKITKCDVLEQIFEEMGGANDGVLSKLETLEICGSRSLKSVFPLGVAKMLVQLKSLNIDGCHKLEQIFEEVLEGANEGLQKLESLEIRRCSSLKSLFPPSVAEKLVQLKKLHIDECDMVEQIIEEMEVGDSEILSANTHLLPNLKTLSIGHCAKLECLIDTRKQHLPAIEVSNLEVLELTGMISMSSLNWVFNGDCPKGLLHKLQTLKIRGCSSITSLFPLSLARNLPQLKELVIEDCDMLEQIFEMVGANDEVLSKLQTLEIKNCGSLKSLFPLSLAQNLQQLKKLIIEDCDMLERLVMEDNDFDMLSNHHYHPRCFQELEELEISKCSKLEYVFPSSLVGNDLPRLKNLELTDLHELEQVIALGKNDSIRIGGGSDQLCNNNPVVAQGKENSSNMEYAVIGNYHVEEIFHLQESGNILSNLEWFQVENLPELRVIWRTPKQLVTLQNLEVVKVVGCNRLRYVFSPLLARNLPKLEYLEIKECEDLEQIVDTSSPEDHHDMQYSLSFPNLDNNEIESCHKLKYVFPISMVGDLQRLREISISKASKLERVFGSGEDKDHVHQVEKVPQLPQLRWLILEELPSLISFSSVDYHFLFPLLYQLKVSDCPQMTTTYSIDSQSRAHAKPQTQVSQQFKDSCIEDTAAAEETMWPRGSDIDWKQY
ncbi:Disease resistance protein [Corchorus capsularis]|uniref:Disease resistance protein n=1 Tax=Corchorus capsularis TaxID=210143 RepID=A0A1R3IFB2_COCAP|nr:Disease resistance protein [Corchorus capsularis]